MKHQVSLTCARQSGGMRCKWGQRQQTDPQGHRGHHGSMDFIQNKIGSHWKVLSRGGMAPGLGFQNWGWLLCWGQIQGHPGGSRTCGETVLLGLLRGVWWQWWRRDASDPGSGARATWRRWQHLLQCERPEQELVWGHNGNSPRAC